ncbi:acyltransferase [Rhizobium sp. 007]|uniref:acyltransferase n=1 Tax=Rhizobium sp. 007 TaxID=2785056 RepID=UPI00188F00AF|nr:acyltransferase [Rhizobium sp. 007]QPB22379.1 acyltransferase [Rhizobium sp. 007]
MKSLNQLIKLQRMLVKIRRIYLVKFWGMDIDPTVVMSMSAKLDLTYPKGIHIGAQTYLSFGAAVLSHDMSRALKTDTRIGRCCFIGARSIIMPGVAVGNHCIVAAGAIVTKDVPDNCVVAGNPATIIRENINTLPYGRLESAVLKVRAAAAAGTSTR